MRLASSFFFEIFQHVLFFFHIAVVGSFMGWLVDRNDVKTLKKELYLYIQATQCLHSTGSVTGVTRNTLLVTASAMAVYLLHDPYLQLDKVYFSLIWKSKLCLSKYSFRSKGIAFILPRLEQLGVI